MIPLLRGEPPAVLAEKAAAWTAKYLERRAANPALRPPKEQYRHPEVLRELRRMSHRKCFYCERVLADSEQEVDHHLEVAERPDLAFSWHNLYLSCEVCNQKLPNTRLPVAACVDPCDPTIRPGDHLAFVDERVEPRAGSRRGRDTIEKYDLARGELDLARARVLREFDRALTVILIQRAAAQRATLTDEEVALLRAWADPVRPFSKMIADRLHAAGL